MCVCETDQFQTVPVSVGGSVVQRTVALLISQRGDGATLQQELQTPAIIAIVECKACGDTSQLETLLSRSGQAVSDSLRCFFLSLCLNAFTVRLQRHTAPRYRKRAERQKQTMKYSSLK